MSMTFYGERGLVNSIILDMGTDIEKQKKFLKTIKFSASNGTIQSPSLISSRELHR